MQRFTSQKKMKILTFSTRRQNSLNGVLDETTTANTRGRSSRAHARLCKFTSGSRPSSSRRPILRSLIRILLKKPFRGCSRSVETPNCRSDRRQTGKNVVYIFDENRKPNSKKQQNRKTEVLAQKLKIPMPPSLASLAFVHGGTTQHSSAQP